MLEIYRGKGVGKASTRFQTRWRPKACVASGGGGDPALPSRTFQTLKNEQVIEHRPLLHDADQDIGNSIYD